MRQQTYDLDTSKPIPDEVGIDLCQRSAMAQFPGVLSDDELQLVALTYLEYIRKGKDWPLACSAAILSVRRALASRGKIIATKSAVELVHVEQMWDPADLGLHQKQWNPEDVGSVSTTQPTHDAIGASDRLWEFPPDLVEMWSDSRTDTEIAGYYGVSRMTAWRWRQRAAKKLKAFKT